MIVTDEARWSPSNAELSHALENDEFEVYYQPIVDLQSGRLAGAEALIRWQHPERGLLSPGSFIEQAEVAGLGIPIAEWIQRAACRQAQAWSVAKLDLPIVSINISPAQVKPVALVLTSAHFWTKPDSIHSGSRLSFTRQFMPEPLIAQTVLAELASVGIPLWADDFGTGPSALPYLTHFPFSVLKIDKGFVWTMMEDPRWARTVTGLIGLAHHLGLRVIAEGVRSAAQIELLREHGCDMIQGGYFSQPVPVDVVTALLQSEESCSDDWVYRLSLRRDRFMGWLEPTRIVATIPRAGENTRGAQRFRTCGTTLGGPYSQRLPPVEPPRSVDHIHGHLVDARVASHKEQELTCIWSDVQSRSTAT